MARERVFTVPLICFLTVVGAVLADAAVQRLWPPSLAEVHRLLADGDLEHAERVGMLERLRAAGGASSATRGDRLAGAMAAVGLEDETGYLALAGAAVPPVQPADVEFLDTAAFGDPVLRPLMQAMLAEAGGHRDDARRRYEQVAASTRLFGMDLAHRLAEAGAVRLR